jgi:Zn-dependent protease with chaperone function
MDISVLRSPKEATLFRIGVALSALVWLAIALTIVGIFYGALVIGLLFATHALFVAGVKGYGVRISERQLPDLYERVRVAAQKLGLREVPEVYLVQSHGRLNAFATRLLSRDFVVVYSSLVDACEDPRQLDFVLGHEIGHLAFAHLRWNAFLAPYRLVPWLGPAYSRAKEYTCDRCGLLAAGDLEQSTRGLAVLAGGGKRVSQVDLAAFEAQRLESGSFWMAAVELVSSHPYLCKRAAALHEYSLPGSVKPVARNPFAWALAPVLGALAPGGAGAAALVATAVIVAAIVLGSRGLVNYVQYTSGLRSMGLDGVISGQDAGAPPSGNGPRKPR